jgi:hypothetical protein
MKTLSPTQARINLTLWLKKAAAGEDIGILCGDKIIALRPVEVHSADYALREYELTPSELDQWISKMDHEIAKEHTAGTIKRYSGNLEADLRD